MQEDNYVMGNILRTGTLLCTGQFECKVQPTTNNCDTNLKATKAVFQFRTMIMSQKSSHAKHFTNAATEQCETPNSSRNLLTRNLRSTYVSQKGNKESIMAGSETVPS